MKKTIIIYILLILIMVSLSGNDNISEIENKIWNMIAQNTDDGINGIKDLNIKIHDDMTPAMVAAAAGADIFLKGLIKKGCDLSIINRYKHTAYDYAFINKQIKCIELLQNGNENVKAEQIFEPILYKETNIGSLKQDEKIILALKSNMNESAQNDIYVIMKKDKKYVVDNNKKFGPFDQFSKFFTNDTEDLWAFSCRIDNQTYLFTKNNKIFGPFKAIQAVYLKKHTISYVASGNKNEGCFLFSNNEKVFGPFPIYHDSYINDTSFSVVFQDENRKYFICQENQNVFGPFASVNDFQYKKDKINFVFIEYKNIGNGQRDYSCTLIQSNGLPKGPYKSIRKARVSSKKPLGEFVANETIPGCYIVEYEGSNYLLTAEGEFDGPFDRPIVIHSDYNFNNIVFTHKKKDGYYFNKGKKSYGPFEYAGLTYDNFVAEKTLLIARTKERGTRIIRADGMVWDFPKSIETQLLYETNELYINSYNSGSFVLNDSGELFRIGEGAFSFFGVPWTNKSAGCFVDNGNEQSFVVFNDIIYGPYKDIIMKTRQVKENDIVFAIAQKKGDFEYIFMTNGRIYGPFNRVLGMQYFRDQDIFIFVIEDLDNKQYFLTSKNDKIEVKSLQTQQRMARLLNVDNSFTKYGYLTQIEPKKYTAFITPNHSISPLKYINEIEDLIFSPNDFNFITKRNNKITSNSGNKIKCKGGRIESYAVNSDVSSFCLIERNSDVYHVRGSNDYIYKSNVPIHFIGYTMDDKNYVFTYIDDQRQNRLVLPMQKNIEYSYTYLLKDIRNVVYGFVNKENGVSEYYFFTLNGLIKNKNKKIENIAYDTQNRKMVYSYTDDSGDIYIFQSENNPKGPFDKVHSIEFIDKIGFVYVYTRQNEKYLNVNDVEYLLSGALFYNKNYYMIANGNLLFTTEINNKIYLMHGNKKYGPIEYLNSQAIENNFITWYESRKGTLFKIKLNTGQ